MFARWGLPTGPSRRWRRCTHADENEIVVLRRENGNQIAIPFDYSEVKKGKKLEMNIILISGDVVVVPD